MRPDFERREVRAPFDGVITERLVEPVRVEGGQLTAYDVRSDDVRYFAIHRVTSVRAAGPARPAQQ